MTLDQFEFEMTKLYDAHGKKVNHAQIAEFFEELKMFPADLIAIAVKQLKREAEKFPALSTLISAVKSKEPKKSASQSHWNGTKCDACEMGLINYTVQKDGFYYSHIARCPKCKSYDAPGIPFYDYSLTEDNYN